ncbi:MAG: enoyl-CoA hydratase/isomerase family protein [Deltaproteobacteria bacterium]|nr:enoyl-CoA hydratase/isomerase family protein [Deltaproteobacteria bacterium]
MSDHVLFEQKGHVAIVTLNRPERMNALGAEVRNGLIDAFLKIRHEPTIRVAVITGAGGKAFSAGADLKEHNEIFQKKSYRVGPDYGALDEPPTSSQIVIETYKPVIAAVNGYALAGGCELALACDIRIASENASFGLPEAKRGRGANFATVMLQYLMPRGIAMEMLFTGEPISAEAALNYGLVNRVVPLTDLMPTAVALAEKIAANAPISLRRIKELSVKSIGLPPLFALKMAPGPSPYESQDAREGAKAFAEKRSATYKGD